MAKVKEKPKKWKYSECATKIKLLETKVVKIDDKLKQIYRIKN